MKEAIAEMAFHYYFSEDELRSAIHLAAGLLRVPEEKTTKNQLRELKARRKSQPGNDDLWAEEFMLLAGQRNDTHKKKSRRTKTRQNAAIAVLMDLWERHHDRGPTLDGDRMLTFIAHALHAAGDTNIPKPVALQSRIDRIRN